MGRGAWKAAVHGVAKSQTQLSDFTFIFHFYALEKEMATFSSILAWRIPGTGEPGGLPSMGSQSRTRLKRLSSSSSSEFPQIVHPNTTHIEHLNCIKVAVHSKKAIASHSSTLAWKIPWTEEPGRLQSMELLRVRHN